VLWVPNDRGSCYLDSGNPDLDNLVVITHFGLHQAPGNKLVNHNMWIARHNGCFRPDKDVVAPAHRMILAAMARHTYLTKSGGAEFEQPRELQLVFAGGSCTGGCRGHAPRPPAPEMPPPLLGARLACCQHAAAPGLPWGGGAACCTAMHAGGISGLSRTDACRRYTERRPLL
jgi:hypothetical protein